MVMIKDREGKERYTLSTKLMSFLDRVKEKQHKEDSMVLGILWGDVGSGKSLLAQYLAYATDNSLDIKRICFNKDEFIRNVVFLRKKAVVGDEGISLFFSRAAMTKEGREIAEVMDQIRQNNLFVLVCVPKLLTLDWTVLESANFVGYVWERAKETGGRKVTYKGNLALYPKLPSNNYKQRIIDYLRRRRRNVHKAGKLPSPWHQEQGGPCGDTFKNPWYPVGEAEYRKKKGSILNKYTQPKKEKMLKKDIMLGKVIYTLKHQEKKTIKDISSRFELPRTTISDYFHRYVRYCDENGLDCNTN